MLYAAATKVISAGNRTYYIDPACGNDNNSGLEEKQPWLTFSHINSMILSAGDRVEVLSPGDFDRSIVLTGAGDAVNPVKINFAPGRYQLFPDNITKKKYNISNTNDDCQSEKAIGILFENASHFSLSGSGALFVCRSKMIEICIDNSSDISVSGLTFDYFRPTVSEFRVVSAEPDSADIEVHKDSTYSICNNRIIWQGENWSYETGLAQELDTATDVIWRRKDPLFEKKIEEIAPYHLRVRGSHDLTENHIYQIRDTFRDCVGIFIKNSRTIVFRKLDFYFFHGMGILCQFSENITLDTVTIAPCKTSGRTCAAWADCAHFSGCRGKIVIRNCTFSGAHDDAVNIHGTHLRIIEQPSENTLRVRFMHRQTYGFHAFKPGDEVDFVHFDSLQPFSVNRITSAELINPREMLLTLDEPVTPDWNDGDVLENVTWTPEVEISGCDISRIPTRGFLLTTRRPVRVINNSFNRIFRNGIHIESDAEGWFESGCVRDMTIAENKFNFCGKEAILISPHNSKSNNSVHRNIRISGNDILTAYAGAVIDAKGTEDLTICNNRFFSESAITNTSAIHTDECSNVCIHENAYFTL